MRALTMSQGFCMCVFACKSVSERAKKENVFGVILSCVQAYCGTDG